MRGKAGRAETPPFVVSFLEAVESLVPLTVEHVEKPGGTWTYQQSFFDFHVHHRAALIGILAVLGKHVRAVRLEPGQHRGRPVARVALRLDPGYAEEFDRAETDAVNALDMIED